MEMITSGGGCGKLESIWSIQKGQTINRNTCVCQMCPLSYKLESYVKEVEGAVKSSFGLCTDFNFILWSEFPSLSTTDFFVLIILYPRGLSHALSNVLQPPWPLPIRVKEHSLLPQLGNPKYLQSLPNVPWKGETASHLRTTEFRNHESVPGSRVIWWNLGFRGRILVAGQIRMIWQVERIEVNCRLTVQSRSYCHSLLPCWEGQAK